MEDKELISIIENAIYSGIGGVEGEISNDRQVIYDRYMGELYGNEKEGSSKITTREVFETVEWAMPALVRPFESGDRVIEFDATSAEDEAGAEQETDAVNHVYRKDNNGFVVTHNVIKSALLNPNSYVKVWREDINKAETEHYADKTTEEMALIVNDDDVEILEQEQDDEGLWTLKVKRTSTRGLNRVMTIPEEDIVVHHNHAELSLDDCELVAHKNDMIHSDLLGRGYDEAELDEAHIDEDYTSEEANRRFYTDENFYNDSEDDQHKALRHYTVWEVYMKLDHDDDGTAELRKVIKIGNKIFENEEIDYMPIAAACSILMPHKHTGVSLAQSILDLQDLKTYFMRQLVTNMGKMNNPRTLITQGANLADCLSTRNNAFIRINKPGDVTTEPTTPIIGQAIPLLELIDRQKEGRTGVSKQSQGLDPNVLSQTTEGAFLGAVEKADERLEFITRVIAETVYKDIFLKIHHLMLSNGDTRDMKLNGKWVTVDPADWKKREAMTVNTGLGTGNRKEKMMAAQVLIQDHDKLLLSGMGGVLVSPQNVYNGRRLLTESLGQKNVDKFYINPELAPPQPPQQPAPDPNMVMIQANKAIEDDKRQVEVMKMQQTSQLEGAKLQFEMAEAQRKQQFEGVELAYQQQIDQLKAQIVSTKNQEDAGNKALQAQIDSMSLQLKDAQEDEKLAIDKYKADLDSETKLAIARMNNEEPVDDTRQAEIEESLTSMAGIIVEMNQPKEIVRDEEGNPIGIRNTANGQVRTIVKDSEGLPVGIE